MATPLQPKTNGGPITKFWDAQEVITALEHVKGWLSKNAKKVGRASVPNKRLILDRRVFICVCALQYVASDPPTAKSLATLISQAIQFQEDNLGAQAKNPSQVRLSVRPD